LAEQGKEDPATKRAKKKALEMSAMIGQAMKQGRLPEGTEKKN